MYAIRSYYAHAAGANFENVDLSGARLASANFTGANLRGANLADAGLRHTNFSGADLSSAKGLTQERLSQACGDETTKLPQGFTIDPCD